MSSAFIPSKLTIGESLTKMSRILGPVLQRFIRPNGNQRPKFGHPFEPQGQPLFPTPFELFLEDVEDGHHVPETTVDSSAYGEEIPGATADEQSGPSNIDVTKRDGYQDNF